MFKQRVSFLLLSAFFLFGSFNLFSQTESVKDVWQISTGYTQSIFPETAIGTGTIEGGSGCSIGVFRQMNNGPVFSNRKIHHAQSLGLHYDLTNFVTRNATDQSSQTLANLHIATLSGWQGLDIYMKKNHMNLFIKGGLRFQYAFSVQDQQPDLLDREEVSRELWAFGFATGARYKRTALQLEYFKDLNDVIAFVAAKNQQVAFRIIYYFL